MLAIGDEVFSGLLFNGIQETAWMLAIEHVQFSGFFVLCPTEKSWMFVIGHEVLSGFFSGSQANSWMFPIGHVLFSGFFVVGLTGRQPDVCQWMQCPVVFYFGRVQENRWMIANGLCGVQWFLCSIAYMKTMLNPYSILEIRPLSYV